MDSPPPTSKSDIDPITILLTQGNVSITGSDQIFSWEARTLSQVLKKISQHLTTPSISIILGDNLSFLAPVFVDLDEKDTKAAVLDKAKKLLNQPLDQLGIDWYQVHKTKGQLVFQLFAVQKSLLTLLGRASQSASLKVDTIKPLAFALAGQTKAHPQPHFILWPDAYTTITLAHRGKVLASTATKSDQVYNHLTSLLSFSQQNFALKPQTIVMPKKTNQSTKDQAAKTGLQIKQWDINPTANSSKEIFQKQDQDTIASSDIFDQSTSSPAQSDQPSNPPTPPAQPAAPQPPEEPSSDRPAQDSNSSDTSAPEPQDDDLDISSKAPKLPLSVTNQPTIDMQDSVTAPDNQTKSKTKLAIIASTILVVIIGIVFGGLLVYRQAIQSNTPPDESDSTPSVSIAQPSPTPSPSPSPQSVIDKSIIKLSVLNGSGVPGAAGKATSILEAADFKDIDTGNADSYDFAQTQISVKADNAALLDLLTTALEDDYTISTTGNVLDEDSDFDAIITVGSQ